MVGGFGGGLLLWVLDARYGDYAIDTPGTGFAPRRAVWRSSSSSDGGGEPASRRSHNHGFPEDGRGMAGLHTTAAGFRIRSWENERFGKGDGEGCDKREVRSWWDRRKSGVERWVDSGRMFPQSNENSVTINEVDVAHWKGKQKVLIGLANEESVAVPPCESDEGAMHVSDERVHGTGQFSKKRQPDPTSDDDYERDRDDSIEAPGVSPVGSDPNDFVYGEYASTLLQQLSGFGTHVFDESREAAITSSLPPSSASSSKSLETGNRVSVARQHSNRQRPLSWGIGVPDDMDRDDIRTPMAYGV
ncbi:hypothetical protein HK102_005057 [Quaeritorhiza haematococci]|nr:hypothetical protein HK102_005057 [Quaeritorhiza haematococci]